MSPYFRNGYLSEALVAIDDRGEMRFRRIRLILEINGDGGRERKVAGSIRRVCKGVDGASAVAESSFACPPERVAPPRNPPTVQQWPREKSPTPPRAQLQPPGRKG
ncbi:hypothetical protein CEXT_125751 [Caerostris extrusa]|uniref:Uncharacterized protein n=1 Tax=Caerostris extrusa TaxID=172846 RepID=A0AAV4M3W0_CAEEX|nr:hypothetical protein CEXT_125751 [Caerostris extrusa]